MVKNQRRAGIMMSYIAMIINILIGVFYTPIMLRMIGQNEYGLFSYASSIIAYVAILDLGLANTLVRYNAKYRAIGDAEGEQKLNGMFLSLYFIIGIISFIIGYLIYNNIGLFFSKTFTTEELYKIKIIILIMTINVSISFPLSVFTSIVTAYEQFVFLKMVSIVNIILSHGLILIALYAGYKSIGMTLISALFSILTHLLMMFFSIKKLKIKIIFRKFDKTVMGEVLLYSFFIFINILIDQLYINTDKVIIGTIIGTAEVAIYTVAMQFQTYFNQFSTSINGVFLPNVTKMVTTGEDLSSISRLFIRVGRIQFLILAFIMSGFILFGKSFIYIWAGKDYIRSYYIALIVMIPAIIPLSQNIGIVILQAKNKHKFRSIVYLIIAILNVVLSIPLAKLYGGIGAALGTAIGTVLGQIITMNWYYHKVIGLDVLSYWGEILQITISVLMISIIGIILNYYLPMYNIKTLFIKILIYSVVSAIIMFKYVTNAYERALIRSLFNKIYKNRISRSIT